MYGIGHSLSLNILQLFLPNLPKISGTTMAGEGLSGLLCKVQIHFIHPAALCDGWGSHCKDLPLIGQ